MSLANEADLSIFFRPRRLGWLCFIICLAGFVMTGKLAPAAERTDGTEKAPSIAFDIPSQPLEAALDAFSSISNALKFTIGPSGGVLQTSLLSSTGDRARDARIVAAVEHLTVGEAPPLELSQPITMVIAPRPPDVTGDCASADRIRANR
jgi:hypothetical protein